MTSAMKSTRVCARRQLHFQSPCDLLAEVDRIYASATVGSVYPAGNWTAAQAFQHLAKFIECHLRHAELHLGFLHLEREVPPEPAANSNPQRS